MNSIWDIGCDHGILGLSFLQYPAITKIHLVDPSIDVIRTLHNKLIDSYITKQPLIEIQHKKGQDVILNPEPKVIFIAGMGGREIQEIIKNLLPQLTPFDRLVISPHRNILELRQFLQVSALRLVDEVAIQEDGQFYQILCLETSVQFPAVSLYGEKIWQGPVGEQYRQHQIRSIGLHQDQASKAYVSYLKLLSY